MKNTIPLALVALSLAACAPVANSISKTPMGLKSNQGSSEMHFSKLSVVALDEDMYVVTEKQSRWAMNQVPGEVKMYELSDTQVNELIKGSTQVKLEGDFRLTGIQFFAVLELGITDSTKIDSAKMKKVKLKWEKTGPNVVQISLNKDKGDAASRKYVQTYLSRISIGYRETTISE